MDLGKMVFGWECSKEEAEFSVAGPRGWGRPCLAQRVNEYQCWSELAKALPRNGRRAKRSVLRTNIGFTRQSHIDGVGS